MNQLTDARPLAVIEPQSGFVAPNLREVWEHRDILLFLVRRDISVRYKQTLIGASWSVLRPALLAVVFSVFLGVVLDIQTGDIPYPALRVRQHGDLALLLRGAGKVRREHHHERRD